MRHRRTTRTLGLMAGAVGLAVAVTACSNSSSSSTTTTSSSSSSTASTSAGGGVTVGPGQPVVVGSIATLTGSLASSFNGTPPGMKAYFDMINAHGGVNGHKFKLQYNLDDAGNPATFSQLAHTLIQQDHVFAVLTSTFWFTPNLFVSTNTPTFGYNVSGNWGGTPGPANLFAAGGSTQNYNTGAPAVAYAIKKTDSHSVAVISYGQSIGSSYNACASDASALTKAGYHVTTFLDAQLAGSYTSDVQRMQSNNVDFVVSCMQDTDNITMSRDLQQYGLTHVHQLWFDGYDYSLLAKYNSLMQGVYLNVNSSVPFSSPATYRGRYPGMTTYLSAMQHYEPNFVHSQDALQGWVSAATLVQGVKMAGNDVSQANVINQINTLTNFTAGGVFDNTSWTTGHNDAVVTYPLCSAFVKAKGNTFVPALNHAPQVFDCFGTGKPLSAGVPSPQVTGSGTPSDVASRVNLKDPVLVAAPTGTPGT